VHCNEKEKELPKCWSSFAGSVFLPPLHITEGSCHTSHTGGRIVIELRHAQFHFNPRRDSWGYGDITFFHGTGTVASATASPLQQQDYDNRLVISRSSPSANTCLAKSTKTLHNYSCMEAAVPLCLDAGTGLDVAF